MKAMKNDNVKIMAAKANGDNEMKIMK